MPVYYQEQLKGVAGIDFKWLDLIADIIYTFQGTKSYSFMIGTEFVVY